MATLRELTTQVIAEVEKKSGKRFEKRPTVRYGRNAKTSTREQGGKIVSATIMLDRKLSKGKYRQLLKPVLAHEIRENLGFQHYESKAEAHKAAKRAESRAMGKKKKGKKQK